MDKVTGGKPKDSLAALQEHTKFQKAVEALTGKERNAAVIEHTPKEEQDSDGGLPKWAIMLAPFVPHVAESIAGSIKNPAAAEYVRQSGAVIAKLVEGASGGGAVNPTFAMFGIPPAANDGHAPASAGAGADEHRTPPRAVREVMAVLADDEAETFDRYLDDLDENDFHQLGREAQRFTSLEERATWRAG